MTVPGIELITRTSVTLDQHATRFSQHLRDTLNPGPTDDRNWSWKYLRQQFREKDLEDLYVQYQQRLQTGYFSVFLIVQMILNLSHIIIILVTGPDYDMKDKFPDIAVYIIVMVLFWPMVILVFRERLVHKYPWLPFLVSCAAVVLLVASDLSLPLYHMSMGTLDPGLIIRPAYATHTLIACYVFLPLIQNMQAVILGLTVTACHLVVLATMVYEDVDNTYRRLASDAMYLLCLNGMGLYYRYMNEVNIRRTFLDRRECVESTIKLKYEKQQEDQLMLSILPRHIVDVVKNDIRAMYQHVHANNAPAIRKKPFGDMYVKEHHNVSILYADVVNYSKLTVSLPVNKLVETLNELFGRFDEASEEHGVLRIKFLGDCYYCVAGVPDSTPHHAKNCVDLGLDMISIIKDVREERKLKQGLDMRIGVHSGNILSGLLGVCKWQYDIWSNDVKIANYMEQAGEAGKVHVTKQTLDLLRDKYKYTQGHGAEKSEFLAKNNIQTYFIIPLHVEVKEEEELASEQQQQLQPQGSLYRKRRESVQPAVARKITIKDKSADRRNTSEFAVSSRRRTVFMDQNLYLYQQTLKQADGYMSKAIKKMRYGVHERWVRNEGIQPTCLWFEDVKWELPYLQQLDPLYKFYFSCAYGVLGCMAGIQSFNMPSDHWIAWAAFGSSFFLILFFMPFLWTFFVWSQRNPQLDASHIMLPHNKFIRFLCKCSQGIVRSVTVRTVAYLTVVMLLGTCALIDLVECGNAEPTKLNPNGTLSPLVDDGLVTFECIPPWQLSESIGLAIIISFYFLKIHFQLKLLMGLIWVAIYTTCVLVIRPNVFMAGETWNPSIPPQVSQIMSVVFLTLTLHVLDRQSEYITRLDYRWKRRLLSEQKDASFTRAVNKMLLENILPLHVAELYLNVNRAHDELYHEEYDSVAVMFASLTECHSDDDDDDDASEDNNEKVNLTVLNEIICDFDKLLFKDEARRIEKIKVTGWTYMAACGLVVTRKDSSTGRTEVNLNENVALVLTRFAASMMEVLDKYNKESFRPLALQVGISHGPVTAGVVGSQKPLYDIWGDAVNMASRMDSTGVPGTIQVTANTAAVLTKEGIRCVHRGDTYIKGKNIFVKTAFVSIGADFQLERLPDNDADRFKLYYSFEEAANIIKERENNIEQATVPTLGRVQSIAEIDEVDDEESGFGDNDDSRVSGAVKETDETKTADSENSDNEIYGTQL